MIEYYWPTEIGYYDNPNHQEIESVLSERCLKIRDHDLAIRKKTKEAPEHWTPGWMASQTYNTLYGYSPHEDELFKPLDSWIREQIKDYLIQTNAAPDIQQAVLKYRPVDSWFNVYYKGDHQELHNHTPSILSCVYFLKSPEGSSPLYFNSPVDDQTTVYNDGNVSLGYRQFLVYDPIPGRLVIFRSFLQHGVKKHLNAEERITLAYNF